MRLRTRLFLVSATAALFAVVSTTLIILSGITGLIGLIRQESAGGLGFFITGGTLLAGLILPILVAALLSWLASRTVGARIGEIVGMANRLSSGDLGSRVRDVRQDEFGELGRALDDAVQSLGQRVGELARDRARMEAILGGMVEGVLVVGSQGQVQLVNEAARTMLRLDDKAIGRRYVELIRHPDIAGQLARALAGEAPGGVELSLGRDLSQTLIARAAPVVAAGNTGAVLVLHDISDLRRADRIRRDFVANVSHELRTPLTAIRGYVEALLDAPPRPEETRRFLEIIARHSSRMERLVKDLLRLARLDAGQEALETAPCSVDALLAGVIGDLTPVIEGRGQHVDVRVAPDASTVSGDPAKLHDVLRNLVENASNYSPEGSRIELSSALEAGGRSASESGSGTGGGSGFVVIRVADKGPGIPETDLTRIFERFYRVDKDRSRESGGTGLGLSIVRHLVELHGGQVRAENRRDGGAIFTVRLPRRH
jgi:two-component system, OmpR family, phosphate regulon sensor histidine kinase PhoR